MGSDPTQINPQSNLLGQQGLANMQQQAANSLLNQNLSLQQQGPNTLLANQTLPQPTYAGAQTSGPWTPQGVGQTDASLAAQQAANWQNFRDEQAAAAMNPQPEPQYAQYEYRGHRAAPWWQSQQPSPGFSWLQNPTQSIQDPGMSGK